jgi:hypothetical protein
MSRKLTLPKIDARQAPDLLRELRRMAPHYTREWLAKDAADPGVALLKIFSFIGEGVINRLNRAPERNFLAFLDMLGIRLLPATPARAPVRFLLAKGTTDAFLVEKGAQVSAPPTGQRPVELPFETIENLWVIPAALTELISVDPSKDHIYKPPPSFLALELAATDLPPLTITAFSAAGSKFLQLDPPDQVKKNDFLRIDHALKAGSRPIDCPIPSGSSKQLDAVDHLVVLDTKGTIVTVTDPLPRDYLENTSVRKVTDFEVFEAKNWQEHVLYLGHAEYFAIKSAAQIELLVEHAGAVANLEALDVVWEFFGIDETDKEKEEKWHAFGVELDGTVGFSRSGRVILNKPAGEIKEKEINGNKSRWIRARLDEPLPATPIRPLPTIESLTFAVASGGEDLAVDQAFHNDTPLTTDVEFFPFGTEPRIFDRFSIASEEAFSKPGAKIDLEFSMDTSDLLASPAAVFIEDKVHVFAIGAGGKLLEFEINPNVSSVALPVDHAMPKDTRLTAGSAPAVVTGSGSLVAVFARAKDELIHMWDRTVGWKALDKTPGTLQFGPVALGIGAAWRVYAVADKKLYWKNLEPGTSNPASPTWTAILDGPRIDSSPFIIDTGGGTAAIFVTDVAGVTWMFRNNWTQLTPELSPGIPKEEFVAAKNARPFAVASKNVSNEIVGFKVYVTNKKGVLVRLNTAGLSESLSQPDSGAASNPFMSSFPGHDRIYVRGKDGHLWSIQDAANPIWEPHETSGGINLDGDPFVIAYPPLTGSYLSIFSTSKKNALMEFRVNRENLAAGNIQFGPKQILLLKAPPQPSGTYYIRIIEGPGKDSSNDAVRKISQEHSSGTFKVLDSPLSESPTEATEFVLMREESEGEVRAATEVTLTLKDGDGEKVRDGDYLFVANQLRRIPTAPESGDEVTIQDGYIWDPIPTMDDIYQLLRVNQDPQSDRPAGRSAIRAVLDPDSEEPPAGFENKYLRITDGPGEGPVLRRIDKYFESTNNVAVDADFIEPPTNESTYVITASSEPEAWYVHKDPEQEKLRPELSWEYFDGRGWVALTVDKDETDKLLTEGSLKFTLPEDVAKTEVAGQENFWIRARIVGGDYGREEFKFDEENKTVTIEKDPIRPPLVKKLAIKYKVVELKPPQICLTFNNLNYLDQTAANVTPDKHFSPYLSLEDTAKAVYFGFDREFEGGPVRLYFDARELEIDERNKPKLTWEFGSDNTWKSLIAEDGTDAFTKPDFVSLILPDGFQNSQQFGRALYWLRSTLSKGEWSKSPLFKGVFPNTVATLQARTIRNEILGSSTGIKNQKFQFQQVPVIENEEVRVLEILTDAEKEQLLLERGEDAVRAITDQRGVVLQTWVRWTEVIEFFDSNSASRHYRLDRATGEIEFGDGVRGRIPPAGGDNIQAFAYQTGGGASGNVMPGEIKTAVTAVAGVDSVINPVAAGGGSDAATNDDMLVIGPAQISHRNRAVTPEDFERLAQEASREVRKVLCRPNRNAGGRHELGWTSVHIVPNSKDAEPMPSLELRRSVQRFLSDRADVTLVDQDHIFVAPPKYVPVSVEVTIFAKSIDVVASAEKNVRQKLDQFLHPLTGGPDGEGWEFGRDLAASDLYALLEDIDEVDHVGTLRLLFHDTESEERVTVDPDSLLASGTHKVDMSVALEKR